VLFRKSFEEEERKSHEQNKQTKMSSGAGGRKTREERKREFELEEARKKGLIAPELDEDGKAINPHIPQYMAAAPWYASEGDGKKGLKHQKDFRKNKEDPNVHSIQEEERRTRERAAATTQRYNKHNTNDKVKNASSFGGGFITTKFRKGACENCGSMTHKKKDCLERPRKHNAKKTGKDLKLDEVFKEEDFNRNRTYEQKRDRYKGFLAEDYEKVVERYEEVEEMKAEAAKKRELERAFKKENKEKNGGEGDDIDDDDENDDDSDEGGETAKEKKVNDIYASDTDSDEDEEKLKANEDAGFGKIEKRIRAPGGGASGTVRNLRLREDTAKYLRNLDPQSAFYDPKTRSMRENPTPNADPNDNFFRGDNAARNTGETTNFALMNVHAWEATTKHGQDVHVQAAPSQAELMYKKFKEKKSKLDETQKTSVLSKYGDASAGKLEDAPEGLVLGQTERFVEYDRFGRVISGGGGVGELKTIATSRYEEDVLVNNHTKIWGSYWNQGRWGYACCHSCVKSSYCVGIKGIEDGKAAEELMKANMERAKERALEKREDNSKKFAEKAKDIWGADAKDVQLDPAKLGEALRKEDERLRKEKQRREQGGKEDGSDGAEDEEGDVGNGKKLKKKRVKYNDSHEVDVTEEDMEAYRMMRDRGEDPMKGDGTNGYDMV
jgi:pre-mRNA-processing factor SLU7